MTPHAVLETIFQQICDACGSSAVSANSGGVDLLSFGPMGQETEFKFIGNEDALERLRQSPALQRLAREQPRERTLHAVYFDTDSAALRKAGIVFRVRTDGKVFVQTIKSAGANVATRVEVKAEVESQAPNLRAIPDKGLKKRIAKEIGRAKLKPVFAVDMRRTTLMLSPKRGTEIEAAFDVGTISCGETRLPVCEFELELVKGDARALIACARELTAEAPLTLALCSKSERGYALATNWVEAPATAERLILPAKATADEAFGRIVGHCLRHFLGNWTAVTVRRDPEGVHQMRVALRRLRSAFVLFGGPFRSAMEELEGEIRWIAHILGGARDLDVFEEEVFRPAAEAHGEDERLNELSALVGARRAVAWQALLDALDSARFRRLVFELAAATLSRPWCDPLAGGEKATVRAARFARRRLTKRYKRVQELGAKVAELDAKRRHELRLMLKKLRYAVEFFASLFSEKETTRFLKRVAALQEVLGQMNDAAFSRALVADIMKGDDATAGVRYAAGVVEGWHLGHLKDRAAQLKRRWRRLEASPSPWA